jgi:hypothetical protein
MRMGICTAVNMLSQFPPPPGCPEFEVTAAGLKPFSSLAERQQMAELFVHAGGQDVLYLAKECLGLTEEAN